MVMKTFLINLAVLFLGAVCFTSCKTSYYQVYSVETEGSQKIDNSIVFENNDCKVYYNLWSNNGIVSFVFLNKTDRDIFINLGQTFFIRNGLAIEYYQGRRFSEMRYTQMATAISSSFTMLNAHGNWNDNIYNEDVFVTNTSKANKILNANAKSVTTDEKEIVCIPAKCYKLFSYYRANPQKIVTCNNKKDYPKYNADIANYTKANSPLIFTNRIAYGFNKDAVAEKHIDNTFWISSIKNYSQNSATEKVYVVDICDNKDKVGDPNDGFPGREKIRKFIIGGPDKFYKFYQK